MKDVHLLIGLILIVIGLIGLVRPTRLHQKVAIKKFNLSKRWCNLVLIIIGIILSFPILDDFMYALGSVIFIFALIGLIRPTLMHQEVKIGRIHFANRLWNLGMLVLALIIMAIFSISAHFTSHMAISDENQKLASELSGLEREVERLTQKCDECEEEEKKQLAELDRLEKELAANGEDDEGSAAAKVDSTPSSQQAISQGTSDEEEERETSDKEKKRSTSDEKEDSDRNSAYPSYRGKNVTCADFSSSTEATAYMEVYGVKKLDRDGDGVACETLGS